MNFEVEKIDIKILKNDLINYFSTAINPFDVDLIEVEEIENLSLDKTIELAKNNGFNLDNYIKTSYEEE